MWRLEWSLDIKETAEDGLADRPAINCKYNVTDHCNPFLSAFKTLLQRPDWVVKLYIHFLNYVCAPHEQEIICIFVGEELLNVV